MNFKNKTISLVIIIHCIFLISFCNAQGSNYHGKTIMLSKMTPLVPKPGAKLTSSLSQLIDIYKREGINKAASFTKGWSHPMKDGKVIILIEAERIRQNPKGGFFTNRIKARLSNMNAHVFGTYKNFVEAQINLDNLKELTEMREIKNIRLPFPKRAFITSEGVAKTGANQWQQPQVAYIKPDHQIKIAVLDLGFKGYQSLLGSELPAQVTTRSFRADGDISADQEHGAAVAEIVHDMAPDAKLYLVNFDLFTEFTNAVTYLISEKVDVISFSIGYFNAGAGDGTGPVNDVVDAAINAGIVWVVAAGNEAVSHWIGSFTYNPQNPQTWLKFSANDETDDFDAQAGDDVYVYMNWNDWYASDQDYDLYVFDQSQHIIASSTDRQAGQDWPVEGVEFTAPYTGTYSIAVYSSHVTKSAQIELFMSKDFPEYYNSRSSLSIPADNARAIAAGATYWSNDQIEYYSSQGPTKDGRIKPDFTAPDGVSTVTYGNGSFFGTSAATPHVSGAIALLKDKISQFSNQEILQILQSRSIDFGDTGKDNLFGAGRLYLLPK